MPLSAETLAKNRIRSRAWLYARTGREVPPGPPRRYRKVGATSNKDWKLRERYGISLADFNRMMFEQNSTCLICCVELKGGKETHVDHYPKTGRIRGLLCSKCNQGLGLFRNSVTLLAQAITYLSK